ncbi:MAG: hypothetical protein AAFN77_23880 [Planctomycetota bacterium]
MSIREKLIPTVSQWSGMLMVTLTINPNKFSSPEAAYRFVTGNRLISRLVRELARNGLLKSRKFFSVFEVQKNGNPHWHVLLESKYVPHDAILEIWNRWGEGEEHSKENPRLGFAWISRPKFEDPKHAAEYATKYLIKAPEQGWPDWVLDYDGQIHRSSRSQRLFDHLNPVVKQEFVHCGICFCEHCREQTPATERCPCDDCIQSKSSVDESIHTPEAPKRKRQRRTMRQRMADCGRATVVLERLEEEVRPGQKKCKYAYTINQPFDFACCFLGQAPSSQLFLDEAELGKLFWSEQSRKLPFEEHDWKYVCRLVASISEAMLKDDHIQLHFAIDHLEETVGKSNVAVGNESVRTWIGRLNDGFHQRSRKQISRAIVGLRNSLGMNNRKETTCHKKRA